MAKVLNRFIPVALLSASGFLLLRTLRLGVYPDFSVYYMGAVSFLQGANPYIRTEAFFSNYVYPPLVVVLFFPFTRLGVSGAALVFTLLSIFCLLAGIILLLLLLRRFSLRSFSVVLFLSVISFPVRFTLGMGQINLLIFFLLCCGVYFWRTKEFISFAAFGFSLAIKFFPPLLIVYLLLKKEWRSVFGILIVFSLVSLAGVVLLSNSALEKYVSDVIPGVTNAYQSDYYNQALSGFIARFISNWQAGIALKQVLSLISLLITFMFFWKKKNISFPFALSVVITLSLLINPFSWQHHFVWLIIPYLLTFFSLKKVMSLCALLLAISYLLVSSNIQHPEIYPVIIESHVFFGTVLLWIVQLYVMRKVAKV